MVLGGLGGGGVVILDRRAHLASFLEIWVVLGVWEVAGCLCLILERIWPLCRQFGWF